MFAEIEKSAIQMLVNRLTFAVYMKGQVIRKTNEPCISLLMFIEGKVEAVSSLPEKTHKVRRHGKIDCFSSSDIDESSKIRDFNAGECFGEECFEDDHFLM